MPAKKMPAKKMPAKSKMDDVVASYKVRPVSEAAATVTKGDIRSGKKARSKASQFGAVTGRTEVYRYGTKNKVEISTPVRSKSGVKGMVTETRTSRKLRPDTSKTSVSWNRGRGGSTKKK